MTAVEASKYGTLKELTDMLNENRVYKEKLNRSRFETRGSVQNLRALDARHA